MCYSWWDHPICKILLTIFKSPYQISILYNMTMTILAFWEAEQEPLLHASHFPHFTRVVCSNLSIKNVAGSAISVNCVKCLLKKLENPQENPLRQKSAPRHLSDGGQPTSPRTLSCLKTACSSSPCFNDSQHAKQQTGVGVIKVECLPLESLNQNTVYQPNAIGYSMIFVEVFCLSTSNQRNSWNCWDFENQKVKSFRLKSKLRPWALEETHRILHHIDRCLFEKIQGSEKQKTVVLRYMSILRGTRVSFVYVFKSFSQYIHISHQSTSVSEGT